MEVFYIISLKDVNKYDLPKDRTSYVNKCIFQISLKKRIKRFNFNNISSAK